MMILNVPIIQISPPTIYFLESRDDIAMYFTETADTNSQESLHQIYKTDSIHYFSLSLFSNIRESSTYKLDHLCSGPHPSDLIMLF